jgi:hypothetical protein
VHAQQASRPALLAAIPALPHATAESLPVLLPHPALAVWAAKASLSDGGILISLFHLDIFVL